MPWRSPSKQRSEFARLGGVPVRPTSAPLSVNGGSLAALRAHGLGQDLPLATCSFGTARWRPRPYASDARQTASSEILRAAPAAPVFVSTMRDRRGLRLATFNVAVDLPSRLRLTVRQRVCSSAALKPGSVRWCRTACSSHTARTRATGPDPTRRGNRRALFQADPRCRGSRSRAHLRPRHTVRVSRGSTHRGSSREKRATAYRRPSGAAWPRACFQRRRST